MAGEWHLRDLQDKEITDILENDNVEVLGDDSDSDEENQIEERKEDSDSEESALSSDNEDDIPLSQRTDLGQRKNYKWHLKEPMQSVRTRRCNIVVNLPGIRQPFTNRRTLFMLETHFWFTMCIFVGPDDFLCVAPYDITVTRGFTFSNHVLGDAMLCHLSMTLNCIIRTIYKQLLV
jgi:hypothetical protein